MTPNQVTALSGGFALAAVIVIASAAPGVLVGVSVCLFLLLSFALDSADGQLARLRGGGSRTGEWLDHVIDCGKNVGLHAAILVGMYRFADIPSQAFLLVPLVFLTSATVTFFAGTLAEKLKAQAVTEERAPQEASLRRSLLQLPGDSGVIALAMITLVNGTLFLAVYSALALASAVLMVAYLVHWYRELACADKADQVPQVAIH